jgi:hypothetical protein
MESNNEEIVKTNVVDHELKEELVSSTKDEKIISGRPFIKTLIIRLLFLLLAIAAFSGTVDKLSIHIMKPVWEYDEKFLNKSLLHASGYMAVLFVPKALLASVKTVELEPTVIGSKAGKWKPGEIFDPLSDIIDDLWDYMGFVIIFVIVQITLLKLIGLVSLKVLLGIGAAFCVVQYHKGTLFGKLGYSFIILAVVTYVVFPFVLFMGAKSYESFQVDKSVRFSENLGTLKEKASDIEFTLNKENLKQVVKTLSQSVNTVWESSFDFFIGAILMFVLIPLLTMGMIIFILRQSLSYLDMPETAAGLETGTKKVLSRIGRRTRSRSRLLRW